MSINDNQSKKSLYFSTRDLLVMAVLAALGGVSSTYVNALSDAVHAALGMPGASQWAAGLHVIWIVLASGILRKTGVGTLTGIVKGVVELMSGNSHGVIILLVNLVAGLLVDFGFLIFKKRQHLLPYLVGGGLSSASNVLVFQLFATLPQNILGISAISIVSFVAFISGIVFAGILPYLLVNSLAKAGIVKIPEQHLQKSKIGWWILMGVSIIAILLTVYLKINLQGPEAIEISGAVDNPYGFPKREFGLDQVTREMDDRGLMTEYQGYPLLEIIEHAVPVPNANTLLIAATDGYEFLLSFEELQENQNIILVEKGKGKNISYDIVGPESSKAWVRNVLNFTVIASEGLAVVNPDGDSMSFDPDEWKTEMDSTQIELPDGSQKLQGVPVWKVVEGFLNETQPEQVIFHSDNETLSIRWTEIEGNDSLRIFTIIEDNGIAFTLAEMSGQVKIYPLTKIVIE